MITTYDIEHLGIIIAREIDSDKELEFVVVGKSSPELTENRDPYKIVENCFHRPHPHLAT